MAEPPGEATPEPSPEGNGSGKEDFGTPLPPEVCQSPSSPAMSAKEVEAFREVFVGRDPETQRFSLWGLLGIVTGASIVLAIGSYVPKPVFAGAVGIATLVTMVALSAMRNPPAVLQAAWWTLLVIYLMAIGSAILG